MRSLLRTGWGPRGDSGSARGRVRATQPASFFFASLYIPDQSTWKEGLIQARLPFLHVSVSAVHSRERSAVMFPGTASR